jgi:hypothetical protein
MKLIIAGNREMRLSVQTIVDTLDILDLAGSLTEIVSAPHLIGPAWSAEEYSVENLDKNATMFPGEWNLGIEALDVISMEMADYADAAVIFSFGSDEPEITALKKYLSDLEKPIHEIKFNKYESSTSK